MPSPHHKTNKYALVAKIRDIKTKAKQKLWVAKRKELFVTYVCVGVTDKQGEKGDKFCGVLCTIHSLYLLAMKYVFDNEENKSYKTETPSKALSNTGKIFLWRFILTREFQKNIYSSSVLCCVCLLLCDCLPCLPVWGVVAPPLGAGKHLLLTARVANYRGTLWASGIVLDLYC